MLFQRLNRFIEQIYLLNAVYNFLQFEIDLLLRFALFTARKMKFSIKEFFIFCAVIVIHECNHDKFNLFFFTFNSI